MDLKTPLGDEVLDLHAGDRVTLSGIVYTARDEAHLRMMEEGIPFDPEGAVIYHCGPIVEDDRIVSAGPTTSARMNPMTPFMISHGIRGIIGKGGMDQGVKDALKGRAVYLAYSGGCAALAASHMTLQGVYYKDLGMPEAVWIIELDRLPLTVGIDAHGNDLFTAVRDHAREAFDRMFTTGDE